MNPSFLTSEKPLRVEIEKIENSQVKLVFSDHQSVLISIKFIPKNAKVGDVLYLNLMSDSDLKLTRQQIAGDVLAEILGQKK
ncbi:MAG: hypothetical protein NTZ65_03160 [Candidatus Berkelbacteria bacterium]|nr:hypothetical protein [Candidatus Berkelbacteria bacterium]